MESICRGLLTWAALKATWLQGENYWAEYVCWDRKCLLDCEPGSQQHPSKCSQHLWRAAGNVRYHREVQNQGIHHLKRWKKWERWKKGKTSWENKVQQLPLALLTARTGNSLENKNWSEIGEIIIIYWLSQLKNRNYSPSWLLEECVVHPLMSLCHRKGLLFTQTGALSSGYFLHCLWFSYTGWAPCTNFPQNLLDKLLDSH